MRLYVGNRLERLLDALLETLDEPLPSPLEPEWLVVPNPGMGRWIAREVARSRGLAAHLRFYFPDAVVWELVRRVLDGDERGGAFEPDVLPWRVLRLLPECASAPGAEPLRAYLGREADELERFQLSRRVAEAFDRYATFRPQLVLGWEEGEGEHWQAELWRRLCAEAPGQHKGALRARFLERMRKRPPAKGSLPSRLSVFGVSALAPLHVEMLAAFSPHVEVTVYALNPSQSYWGDLSSGPPLLASLGSLGRDFYEHLLAGYDFEERVCFEDPGQATLLRCLQSDLLHLRPRGGGGGEPPLLLDARDRSLQVHSCHGPLREVEVVHDTLLSLFEELPDLRPEDVVVMAPDMEAYAPFAAAVFVAQERPRRIPYTLAERPGAAPGAELCLRLLELCGSRLEASGVLDLLELEGLRRRFGLAHEDLEPIARWVEGTRIRWGRDAEERRARGFPAYGENSWAAGLDRMLLGYAMAGEGDELFRGMLPWEGIEGPEAQSLGRFCELADAVFTTLDELRTPRPPAAWAETFRAVLRRFLPADEAARAEEDLRDALGSLEAAERAGFREPLELRTIRHHLRELAGARSRSAGFLSGGVTFCTLRPMRSLPFRVVALLGLDDGVFPRRERRLGFDLLAEAPRRGDPSARAEDRYLFLEALLSARDVFYLSYVGQSARDGSEAPPSVLVSELLDAAEQGFRHPDRPILDHLVTRHRIQAFSPAYFKPGADFFSYSEENCRAALARATGRRESAPFLTERLAEPDASWRAVPLARLAECLSNPCRFLLRHRFGVDLSGVPEAPPDRETFSLEGLERYALRQELAGALLSGEEPAGRFLFARARGQLPPGNLGAAAFKEAGRETARVAARVSRHLVAPERPPLEVDLSLGEFRLTGTIPGVWDGALVRWRCAKLNGKDWVRLWVEHLTLNCLEEEGLPRASVLVGSEDAWRLAPVEDAPALLSDLLALYGEALLGPLPFFPESSLAYALRAGEPEAALAAAVASWVGNDFSRAEGEDLAYRICFGPDALGARFRELAKAVYAPLLGAREKS
ncbi:MAG: exodeoxyribonuclease V subunit gamma [Deltaproteobacteria bacterium]|nr:exodeoxyribonuclease V subunit gamma [Deltaproteobacteria bacterium]